MTTYQLYKKTWLWKRIDFDWMFKYQCVDLARSYAVNVFGLPSIPFGWTAYKWWIRRNTVFPWKKYVEWFSANIPIGSIVIFKPSVPVQTKKPWLLNLFWKNTRLTYAWHVGIIDYIDNDWVMRILEQNGKGTASGLWDDAIRLMWYKGKDAVAWFILP